MNSNKNKTYFLKKILFTSFLVLFFCFWQAPKAQATVWPGVDPVIKQGLEVITNLIQDLMVSVIKQAAIQSIVQLVDSSVGRGAGGQPSFITNWDDFLIGQPENNTNIYMNDYISRMTRGRNSYSGYSTEGFTGPANYAADLGQLVNSLGASNAPEMSYEGDPSQMFDEGNFKNMELYLSGVNNPWAFNIAYENEQQKKLEEEKYIAQTQAIAYQGFRGTPGELPGTVTKPGILIKENVANTENLPNLTLANAGSLPEMIVAALVNQMVSRSITGYSSVQRSTSRSAASENRYNSSINSSIDSQGPEARFGN
ncbi:MAG TPA: hypothetical protein P5232_02340 [Candidatus Moranbacteria bacterium]|nr:hypothetical protein [Candidatus Moranbacteria bacterium]